jgi:hypothetical protein
VSTDANKEKSSSKKSSNKKSSSEEEIRRGPKAPSTLNTHAPAEADNDAECAHYSFGDSLERYGHKKTLTENNRKEVISNDKSRTRHKDSNEKQIE